MKDGRFQVVIADDEKIIRDGLRQAVSWENCGFVISGMACNGKEALALCERYNPELLITDILMPEMDGLELIESAKARWPGMSILILTSHADFSYARQALQMGVDDYILKHQLHGKEMARALEKIKNRRALRNRENSADALARLLEGGDIPDKSRWNGVLAVLQKHTGRGEAQNWFAAPEDTSGLELCEPCAGRLAVLVRAENTSQSVLCQKAYAVIRKMLQTARERSKPTIAVIAGYTEDFRPMHDVYKDLSEVLEKSFYTNTYSVLSSTERAFYADAAGFAIFPDMERFRQLILTDDLSSIDGTLDTITQRCTERRIRPDEVKKAAVQFMVSAVEFFNQYGFRLTDLYETASVPYSDILSAQSIWDIRAVFVYFFENFRKKLLERGHISSNKDIRRILNIIDERYSEELTLKDLAAEVNISYNYLVTMFRREIGMGFGDYLTQKRLRTAKALLKNTELKVYEIAERVGYKDASYFSQQFRKSEGETPYDYRQKL